MNLNELTSLTGINISDSSDSLANYLNKLNNNNNYLSNNNINNYDKQLDDLINFDDIDLTTIIIDNVTDIPYTPYIFRPETYIIPILFAFIFIIGVLGNGTLIIVFLRHRAMRNVPNTYILSLALADLLVILTTVPLTSIVYTLESWPWGSVLCTTSEFVKDVSIGVSVFTLTALSGDRFFAIVDPLRKFHAHGGGRRATRMTIATAISIWILAIICGMPALFGSYVKVIIINKNKSIKVCYPFPLEWGKDYAKSIILGRFLIYYAIPLLIVAIFYILIARQLMRSAQNVPGELQGTMRQIRARRKVAITVLAFVVIFGVCFLPQHFVMLWFYYSSTAEQDYNLFWHILRIIGFCLSFANSCANPVALYCVSGAFRKHFNRYLLCRVSSISTRHQCTENMGQRDTSLTSTISRRYPSRRLCDQNIRRSVQETTIFVNGVTTVTTNANLLQKTNNNNINKNSIVNDNDNDNNGKDNNYHNDI